MSSRFLVLTICLFCGHWGHSQITVKSPTTEWTAIFYPDTVSDYPLDVQATSIDRDIVGDAENPGFYTRFDDAGTDLVRTDGWMGFRLRVAGDQSPAGFSGQVWVGADVDENGSIDIFVGADSARISIHDAGAGDNLSPSTTSIDSTPLWSVTSTADLFDFSPVTATLDPSVTNLDIDGKGNTDYFLSFVIPFSEFVLAVQSLTSQTDFDDTAPLAYIAATASQPQTLNSDLNGISGNLKSSVSWSELGGLSPTLGVDGEPYAVPEPKLATLVLGLASLGIFVVRKRRQR